MAYNSSKFDQEAHYASKSTKQLQELLKNAIDFEVKYPQFKESAKHKEYVSDLKARIAGRIGKK